MSMLDIHICMLREHAAWTRTHEHGHRHGRGHGYLLTHGYWRPTTTLHRDIDHFGLTLSRILAAPNDFIQYLKLTDLGKQDIFYILIIIGIDFIPEVNDRLDITNKRTGTMDLQRALINSTNFFLILNISKFVLWYLKDEGPLKFQKDTQRQKTQK
jgi:hypothetical protein